MMSVVNKLELTGCSAAFFDAPTYSNKSSSKDRKMRIFALLLFAIALWLIGACEDGRSTDFYASRTRRTNQSRTVLHAIGGYTGNIGGEPFTLIPDGMGGYIGQIGDKPFFMLSDGSGGYIGQVGDKPLLMLPNGVGGYIGRVWVEPLMMIPDRAGGYVGNIGNKTINMTKN